MVTNDYNKQYYHYNALDYIGELCTSFLEISGDRLYGDDPSMVCGIASLDNHAVSIIAQLNGRNLDENLQYNFSMNYPEGFRKAIRMMKQAEKFRRPIICFIDTIGAYMGAEAEERGQYNAIANCISEMMFLTVPVFSILIGEGYSGGAVALCAANDILALESAYLGVISPRAAESILNNSFSQSKSIVGYTAVDLKNAGIVDEIIFEDDGTCRKTLQQLSAEIKEYLLVRIALWNKSNSPQKIIKQRIKKYRNMGVYK